MSDTPTLHLYGQSHWHEPAYLVGSRAALLALSLALQQALATGDAQQVPYFVADGEGYTLEVRIVPDDEAMERYATPYSDRELCGGDMAPNPQWPLKR